MRDESLRSAVYKFVEQKFGTHESGSLVLKHDAIRSVIVQFVSEWRAPDERAISMHATNLAHALTVAIGSQTQYEREELQHTSDSAFLAGLKQVLEAMNEGRGVDVVGRVH